MVRDGERGSHVAASAGPNRRRRWVSGHDGNEGAVALKLRAAPGNRVVGIATDPPLGDQTRRRRDPSATGM